MVAYRTRLEQRGFVSTMPPLIKNKVLLHIGRFRITPGFVSTMPRFLKLFVCAGAMVSGGSPERVLVSWLVHKHVDPLKHPRNCFYQK